MPYLFTPPSVQQGASVGNRLFRRMSLAVGQTLLKKDGFYTLVLDPDGADVDAADLAYLGGHTYLVTSKEATSLTAAGYGAYLSPVPTTGAYGSGSYGSGTFGAPRGTTPYGSGPYGYALYGE